MLEQRSLAELIGQVAEREAEAGVGSRSKWARVPLISQLPPISF